MLKDQFAQSRKMLDIREKYYNEFSKILSQKQIMKIYQQEKSNMNKFRKEFDRRKGQKPGQGHKPGQDRQRKDSIPLIKLKVDNGLGIIYYSVLFY